MKGTFDLFSPTTSEDMPNATSSPVSVDGVEPCGSQGCQTTSRPGRVAAPASRSAWQEKAKPTKTTGIFGLRSSASSASCALQQSLANRLQEGMASLGSTMFALTWRAQATPQRRRICQLAASALHTSGRGFGGLPTPTASDVRNRGTVGRTPATTRRMRLGKQIGFSMLFDPMPCHWCVGNTMGYPRAWEQCEPTGMPSSRKSLRSSSVPTAPLLNGEICRRCGYPLDSAGHMNGCAE
jgi:hypothetical protein